VRLSMAQRQQQRPINPEPGDSQRSTFFFAGLPTQKSSKSAISRKSEPLGRWQEVVTRQTEDPKQRQQIKDYGHRIGRTGRAGNDGASVAFITTNDEGYNQYGVGEGGYHPGSLRHLCTIRHLCTTPMLLQARRA
jgi:hypothetical protein